MGVQLRDSEVSCYLFSLRLIYPEHPVYFFCNSCQVALDEIPPDIHVAALDNNELVNVSIR